VSSPESREERDETRTLDRFVEYQKTRSRALRNELIEEHLPLAHHIARRFARRGEPLEDLRQVALVGLLKAVERFDPTRGVAFSSFATPTILGELRRHFRDRGWTVRVPRRIQELVLAIDTAVADLTQELQRVPTPSEIATRLGVDEESVLECSEFGTLYRPASIDAPARPETGSRPTIASLGVEDRELLAVEDRAAVVELLALLPERERTIVSLRFLEGLTQSEIAARVGLSQMHVSRLLSRSIEQLGRRAVGTRA
jgi:RNA polymerase sigma-B factor